MKTYITQKNLIAQSKFLLALIILTFTALTVSAQTTYKAVSGSTLKVLGTSNLHDWEMTANSFTAEAQFTVKENELQGLNSLSFTLPVKNLKSKDNLMDTRAYKTLKADQYTKISFKLNQASIIPAQKIIKATGDLSISGVTKEIPMQVNYTINSDGSITCTGSKKIKMSDFKIPPPSFMMGALKTGDEVTIEVNLKLK